MRSAVAMVSLALGACFGGGGDPIDDPCGGGSPGIRVRLMDSQMMCSPTAFNQVTFTVSSLGSADAVTNFGFGAAEYVLPWPTGTVPDVPGLVRYQAYYGNGEGRGQAAFDTAPSECITVDLVFDCYNGPPDAGPDAGLPPDAGP